MWQNFRQEKTLGAFQKKIASFFEQYFFGLFPSQPFQIGIFGLKGAGKTTYLARYYQYLRDQMGRDWNAICEDGPSRAYLHEMLQKISQGQKLETSAPQSVKITICRQKEMGLRLFSLHTWDISGGDFEQLHSGLFPLEQWNGLVFILDPIKIDEKTKGLYEQVLFALASKKKRPPLLFLFSKLDHPQIPRELKEDLWEDRPVGEPFIQRARFFAKQKLPGCYKMAIHSFEVEFFAITAFGDWMEITSSEGKTLLIPDKDKPPIGLHRPMEWLCDAIRKRRNKKILIYFFSVVLFLCLICAIVFFVWS